MADLRHTDGHRRPLLRTVVGEVLRRRRLEQHRTLAEVARDANVSVQYLSEIERGLKEPSSEIVAAVCDSLSFELVDLLDQVRQDLTGGRATVLRFGTVPLRRAEPAPAPIRSRRGGDVVLLAA
ncbi:helix-turn-helix domain-containing protein [Pseudosporangium ferrugineum]|nr:helix-turn-helix transcriptional regulator [Pseudosporangium ferrugineum]